MGTQNNIKLESGKEYTLVQLFSGSNKIIIPDLQRDYCWGDKAWDKDGNKSMELVSGFIESLKSSFDDYKKNPDEKLTLGLIYGYENPRYHIQLCDGQQRITTLFLLLGMINRKTENEFQEYLISNYELKYDDQEPYLQYAIRESTLYFLSDLVCNFFLNGKEIKVDKIKEQDWYFREYDLDASIQSMLAAIKTIDEKLNEYVEDSEFELKGFGDFIVNNLQMLYYDMGNRTRGEETFVVINTTGEPLTATENLKPILIGNINDKDEREKASKEWEVREEWFWENRDENEQTSDDASKDFYVWYWQIQKSWENKKSSELNPRELFKRETDFKSENGECITDSVHEYFLALKKLIEKSQEEKTSKVLYTIQEDNISLAWFRKLKNSEEVVLPLIAYLKKYKEPAGFYEFVRRIRKNYYDGIWDERKSNHVDWRHIIKIINFSENEEKVLKFEINEWYNEEEKIKAELKKQYTAKIEEWEDYPDFMGDIRPLFRFSLLRLKKIDIPDTFEELNKYIETIEFTEEQSKLLKQVDCDLVENIFTIYKNIKENPWFQALKVRFGWNHSLWCGNWSFGRDYYEYLRWNNNGKNILYQNWFYYVLNNIENCEKIDEKLKFFCKAILFQADKSFFETTLEYNNEKEINVIIDLIQGKVDNDKEKSDNSDFYYWNGFIWSLVLALENPEKRIQNQIVFDVFDRKAVDKKYDFGNQFVWSNQYGEKTIKVADGNDKENFSWSNWQKIEKELEENYDIDMSENFISGRKKFIEEKLEDILK